MIKQLIIKEIDKVKALKPAASNFSIGLTVGIRLVELALNYVVSRWYFRKANDLGRLVFTRNKPSVINQGYLKVGNLVRIWSNINKVQITVGHGGHLEIGENTRINGSEISVSNKVVIGKNCRIAPHVIIMDDDFHDTANRLEAGKSKPIIIEDDAWVATRSMVLKGVRIGKGAVVAAGSIVTKDVPDYTVVAGIPAKIVKRLNVQETTATNLKVA